jgi:hypothetical protein
MGHGVSSLVQGIHKLSSSLLVSPFSVISMVPCAFSYAFVGSGLFETLGYRSHRHICLILVRSWAIEIQPLHLDLFFKTNEEKGLIKQIRIRKKTHELDCKRRRRRSEVK